MKYVNWYSHCKQHSKIENFYFTDDITYVHTENSKPCCISDAKFHQLCQCDEPLSKCKLLCDVDTDCKGYVEHTVGKTCQYATTNSTCQTGCDLHYQGNFGPLNADGKCGGTFGGCHIKDAAGR